MHLKTFEYPRIPFVSEKPPPPPIDPGYGPDFWFKFQFHKTPKWFKNPVILTLLSQKTNNNNLISPPVRKRWVPPTRESFQGAALYYDDAQTPFLLFHVLLLSQKTNKQTNKQTNKTKQNKTKQTNK